MHLGLLLAATAVAVVSGERHGASILNQAREDTAPIPAMLAALADGGEAGMAAAQTAAEARGESFAVRRDKTSLLTGVRHVKIDQHYDGRRVFPGVLIRHEGNDGKWLSGSYAANLRADVGATDDVSDADAAAKLQQLAAAAIAAVADAERRAQAVVGEEHSEVIVYVAGEGTAARLAFYIYFVLKVGDAAFSRPYYIVDARIGSILRQWKGLDKQVAQVGEGPGGNAGGSYVYGGDQAKFWVTQSGSTCHMVVPEVLTADLRTGFINEYPCFYYDGDPINGALSPMNDGQAMGKNVLDFYLDWYGENPIGFQLIMAMHWSELNAVWTGTQMQYGDGDGVTWYPLISLDVAAHEVCRFAAAGVDAAFVELSHGFTEFNSGLIYSEESGGMNEAFSDMVGVAAEFWLEGVADWMVGERIRVSGQPLRWLDNPPLDGVSIDHADNFFGGMDVHYSSGVYNKAFYLIATAFDDMRTAMDLFYCANEAYWTPDSTFDLEAGATGVGLCALDLGICVKPVYCAFASVGVTMGSLDGVCDSDPCVNGVCINVGGMATCRCCDGFSGATCSTAGSPCDPSPCENGGTCSSPCGTAACVCPAGFTGDMCDTDIDECADGLLVCDSNAQCTNTIGSATCSCNDGYTGDGFTCTDIDECADGLLVCDSNAQCMNTIGSATCSCNDGYTGDGFTCTDIDECADGLLVCDSNAQCTNTIGSATCSCNDGYTGDGLTCTQLFPSCDACNGTEGVDACKKYGYCFAVCRQSLGGGKQRAAACSVYCKCMQKKTGKQAKWKCGKLKKELATTCSTCAPDLNAAGCEGVIGVDTCGMYGCVQGAGKKFCGKGGPPDCLDFDAEKLLGKKDNKNAHNTCLP